MEPGSAKDAVRLRVTLCPCAITTFVVKVTALPVGGPLVAGVPWPDKVREAIPVPGLPLPEKETTTLVTVTGGVKAW